MTDTAQAEMVSLKLLGHLTPDRAFYEDGGYYLMVRTEPYKVQWAYLAHPIDRTYTWQVLLDMEMWCIEPNLELVSATWNKCQMTAHHPAWSAEQDAS